MLNPNRYNILIEFVHRHLDFHRAELESVLSISDIVIGRDCTEVKLPTNVGHQILQQQQEQQEQQEQQQQQGDKHEEQKDNDRKSLSSSSCEEDRSSNTKIANTNDTDGRNSNGQYRRPFLILSFSYDYARSKFNIDNDETEIISDDSINGGVSASRVTKTSIDESANSNSSKLSKLSISLNSSTREKPTVASILSRCTLIRSAIELWGAGEDIDSCTVDAEALKQSASGQKLLSRHFHGSGSSGSSGGGDEVHPPTWKITVHTLGAKYNREEQNEMRKKFTSVLDFPGKIQLENPTHEYIIIREIALTAKGGPVYPRRGLKKEIIPEHDKLPPLAVYYGRILGGRRDWRGQRIEKYNLKKRAYLGPTSMDSELSLIMTNLGKVQKGSFCFDPFVGTGSILLTCGLRGGYCMGTDIDVRVLRGRSDEENVFSNFMQYNLGRPELVRSDNALYSRHYRSHKPLYDAIICDPPYGIRAGARKTGSKLEQPRPVLEEHRHDHIAQTKVYAVSDVMADLLDVAARTLVMGGRLVYIIPSMTDFDVQSDLPQHECLKLMYICYQPLQIELGRRMVTMEKIKEYDVAQRENYLANTWVNGPEAAEKCAKIRERLLEAAKLKPDYEQKAAMRKKRRQETRAAKKRAKRESKLENP